MIKNSMTKTIKEIHNDAVCMFKIGGFFHTYGRDADIVSYLFNYKIKVNDNYEKDCGFPLNSLNKVTKKLQEENINYLIIDRRNNFEVDEKMEYESNNYMEYYKKANKHVNIKIRIQNLNNYLLENVDSLLGNDKLKKVEEIIYD